jgi:hypothetical protein
MELEAISLNEPPRGGTEGRRQPYHGARGIPGASMISNVKGKTEISPDLPD